MPASGLVAGRPPNVRHFAPRATASASKLMGLVTLWDGSENHECALPLWCQQAHRLAAKIPPPWRTQLVVMAPKSSAECNASYVWSNNTARANRAYLDRTPIKGSWSYLKHCTLLKWGVFALSHLDLVLYADVDVDLDPTRFQFHRALLRPEGDPTRFQLHETFVALFRASIDAFLQSSALIVSEPDHASPINTGVFLAKPTRWVHAAGLRCLRSCNFSEGTGFDEAGEPQKLFGNQSRRLWQQLEAGTGSPRGSARTALQSTEMWKKNTWSFVAGNLEQGMFWHLLYHKHGVGTWARPSSRWQADHFWGPGKPWGPRGYAMNTYLKRVELPAAPTTRCQRHLARRVKKLKDDGKWDAPDGGLGSASPWTPHHQAIAPSNGLASNFRRFGEGHRQGYRTPSQRSNGAWSWQRPGPGKVGA